MLKNNCLMKDIVLTYKNKSDLGDVVSDHFCVVALKSFDVIENLGERGHY